MRLGRAYERCVATCVAVFLLSNATVPASHLPPPKTPHLCTRCAPARQAPTLRTTHTARAQRPLRDRRFALSHQPINTQDRVLRYPDGVVRTIRYPVPAQYPTSAPPADAEADAPDRAASPISAAEWHICGENDVGCLLVAAYDVDSSLPGAAPVGDLWGDERRESSDEDLPLPPLETVTDSDDSDDDTAVATGTAAAGTEAPARGRGEASPSSQAATSNLPASPAELLALFTSDEYRQRQREHERRVHGSYRLLFGSPWVATRDLFVLAVQRAGQEHPAMYTLPTSVEQVRHVQCVPCCFKRALQRLVSSSVLRNRRPFGSCARITRPERAMRAVQPGAQSELAALLGADVASRLSVQHMADGVVTFEEAAAVDGYRDALEAGGNLSVTTSRIDSHELFRAVGDAMGVVVLMGQGEVYPTPAELAAALRRKVAFDDL